MARTNDLEPVSLWYGWNRSRRGMAISARFYIGIAVVVGALIVSILLAPGHMIVDQHANPEPAGQLPAQVVRAPGSHLYHASASCPYAHPNSKSLPTSEAIDRGLVPCPYCIGNSSARLTTAVIPRRSD